MNHILKIIKNEFIKFFHGKKILFIIALIIGMCGLAAIAYQDMINIAVNDLPKAETYSNELRSVLVNMNAVNFSKLFLTDFVYKGYFSFYILFIILIATDVFSVDNESRNMKFTLLTGIKASRLYIGKIVYVFCVSLAIVLFNFMTSIILGQIIFGGNIIFSDIAQVLLLSILAVFPAVAMAVIIALLAQCKISSKLILGIGIVLSLILGVADTLSQSKIFSPIGAVSIYNESVPALNSELVFCVITSCIYLVIGIAIIGLIVCKRDYYE